MKYIYLHTSLVFKTGTNPNSDTLRKNNALDPKYKDVQPIDTEVLLNPAPVNPSVDGDKWGSNNDFRFRKTKNKKQKQNG